ncbi:helix-turn-helix transcriptional regulator [Streptomyces lunaelactis]|uniref:helix-turn-helix domain-containing protein n=1 Tax=Streptomyces lunaelactis TaxID=1535768 RepID=UPI001584FBAB|nr:helix-turn-helix transcriptional regulator [Streptomyces lunaelactis]NUL03567.1 helix-turn-helix transcriptional regulator [Streptomyces lunaelactis]
MPTTKTDPGVQGSRTERFGAYMRRAAQEAGYDIDSPRGGGKKALAEATGMSASSVGRMLAGQTMPDPNFLERLADVLGVPLPELLVQSGLVSRDALPAGDYKERRQPPKPTPAEAARQLGIKSPPRVAMFESLVAHLLDEEEKESGLRGVG